MNKSYKRVKIFVATLSAFAFASGAMVLAQNTTASYEFTSDLSLGSTGEEVIQLQNFLEAEDLLVIPQGVSKGYFGELTRSALSKYQESNKIIPSAGYFGPITRGQVNILFKAGMLSPIPTPDAGSSSAKALLFTTLKDNEVLTEGSVKILTWTPDAGVAKVNLDLYKAGKLIRNIAKNIKNTGSYEWTVPAYMTPQSKYNIVVTDSANRKVFDATEGFSVTNSSDSSRGGGGSSSSTSGSTSGGSSGGSGSGGSPNTSPTPRPTNQ